VQEGELALARSRHPFQAVKRLECDRACRGHALEQRQVVAVEGALALVQHLRDTDRLSLRIPDRRTQERPRREARLLVDVPMEARIGVGVVHDFADAVSENGAGDAEVVQEPNLARAEPRSNMGVQLARFLVVEEEGAAFGTYLLNGSRYQRVKDSVERVQRRNLP
jgi:hypothetical protein